ncbi:MAG: hypothetical protein R3A43_09260 [Bacteroidia bacterium]
MKVSKIFSVASLVLVGLFLLSSCGGPKTCSRKGKTKVPMGYM